MQSSLGAHQVLTLCHAVPSTASGIKFLLNIQAPHPRKSSSRGSWGQWEESAGLGGQVKYLPSEYSAQASFLNGVRLWLVLCSPETRVGHAVTCSHLLSLLARASGQVVLTQDNLSRLLQLKAK